METNTTIKMFDHLNKQYVEIRFTENGWERWVSKNKERWQKTAVCKTLDLALRYKEEIINNNFRNFFNIVSNKK